MGKRKTENGKRRMNNIIIHQSNILRAVPRAIAGAKITKYQDALACLAPSRSLSSSKRPRLITPTPRMNIAEDGTKNKKTLDYPGESDNRTHSPMTLYHQSLAVMLAIYIPSMPHGRLQERGDGACHRSVPSMAHQEPASLKMSRREEPRGLNRERI